MADTADERPDPDALLKTLDDAARQAVRGKLRVYFGASAGVGKTYAMLVAARAQAAQGVDVLAGIVETHGRRETAALLDGIPTLPLRTWPIAAMCSRSSTWTARWRAIRRWRWWTSWRTRTRPARAMPSAGRTSRKCWPPASMSGPR